MASGSPSSCPIQGSETVGPAVAMPLEMSRLPSRTGSAAIDEDADIVFLTLMQDLNIPVPKRVGRLSFASVMPSEELARIYETIRHKRQDPQVAIMKAGLPQYGVVWAEVEKAAEDEEEGNLFWEKVAEKINTAGLTKMEAIFEVYVDRFVEKTGSADQALLWVLQQEQFLEFSTGQFVSRLLKRGAKVTAADHDTWNTPLHLAAIKGFTSVGKLLIENEARAMVRNKDSRTPLELAVLEERCEFATLMVKSMQPARVRQLFLGSRTLTCSISMHKLLETPKWKSTALAVLDTMKEPLPGGLDTYLVHYSILEGDEKGRPPNDPLFVSSSKSCVQKIASCNDKDIVYHDVVRLLLLRKWKQFAKWHYLLHVVYFFVIMACLTCALVLAAKKKDPRKYDEPYDIFRGCCEILSFLMITYNGVAEINQFRIHGQLYFLDASNYLDVPAVVFVFFIIPFRVAGLNVQWVFASLAYLFNGLRAFKYASVVRSTGAYVEILLRIMLHDMLKFGAIFLVILFSFSGAFYLALRGEVRSEDAAVGNTTVDNNTVAAVLRTSLDNYPFETSEFYNVLFTGLRVMVEGTSVIDEYFGPLGFGWLGVIIYTVFLFLVIVVLLNLLIAQMSDTYTSVQEDAQRSLAINRAWIIARVEHHSLLADYRTQFYESSEIVRNIQEMLKMWEAPPLSKANKLLEKMEQEMKQQKESIEELRKALVDQKMLLQQLMMAQNQHA